MSSESDGELLFNSPWSGDVPFDVETVSSDLGRSPIPKRPWSKDEDRKLREAIEVHGDARGKGSAWNQISSLVGGNRTNKDCRKRWFHSLHPTLKKGKWSREEDERLRDLYEELGPRWKDIALRIPGRKDDQVSKRWRDVLSPDLTPNKAWTILEDALLLQLYDAHGPKWTIIASLLPGRSPMACRNRSRKYQVCGRSSGRSASLKDSKDGAASQATDHEQTTPSDCHTDQSNEHVFNLPESLEPVLDTHCMFNFDWPMDIGGNGEPSNNNSNNTSDHAIDGTRLPAPLSQIPLDGNQTAPNVPILDNTSTLASQPATQSYVQTSTLFDQWLEAINHENQSLIAKNPADAATTQVLPVADDTGWSGEPTLREQTLQTPQETVRNAWGLLAALDSGQATVTVSSELLRKLVAEAAQHSHESMT